MNDSPTAYYAVFNRTDLWQKPVFRRGLTAILAILKFRLSIEMSFGIKFSLYLFRGIPL